MSAGMLTSFGVLSVLAAYTRRWEDGRTTPDRLTHTCFMRSWYETWRLGYKKTAAMNDGCGNRQ